MEYLDLDEKEIQYIETNCNELDEDKLKELFDDLLDEIYEPVQIFSWEVAPSIAFEKIDPIAYDMALREELDFKVSDDIYALIDGCYYYQSDVEEALEEYNAELAMND